MAISIPDRVVVFDYGEVISFSPSVEDRAALLELAQVDEDAFWPQYWQDRDALDRGTLSTRDYWVALGEDLGAQWSAAQVQQLWVADFRSWLSVNPSVFEIIAELHSGGTRLALLSNAGSDYGSCFRFGPLGALFEQVFVSAEMGELKPEPAIYLEAAAKLGIAPTEMVFIDNKEINVRGAASLGIVAHHFVEVDALRAFLESF